MRRLLLTPIRKTALLSVVAVSTSFSPLVAQEASNRYQDCLDNVIAWCDRALEESSWWEKPAVGVACTGMLAGCGVTSPF